MATKSAPTLGGKLKAARVDANLTLADVSRATGGAITGAGLSYLENDKASPSFSTLLELVKALRLTVTITPSGIDVARAIGEES